MLLLHYEHLFCLLDNPMLMNALYIQYHLQHQNTHYNVYCQKKSSSRLSGGCAIVITTGKKSSSRLSGGCPIVITTGTKKSSSRLSGGWAIVITTGKKSSSRLSGRCAITTISTMGPIYAKSSDFYAKLNVSNLNVMNLY